MGTESELHSGRPLSFVGRVVDFLFSVLSLGLLVRFGLELVRAAPSAGFSEFIQRVTEPFLSPFRGILGTTWLASGYVIVWSILVAIIAYALLHAVIRGLLRLVGSA
jgi:uncharacterized protein YggT (Ycf19 family)